MSYIAEPRQYWFLSSIQERIKTSEVYQATMARKNNRQFVSFDRCFGVDWDKSIIRKNKKFWPEVHWFCSEWSRLIRSASGKSSIKIEGLTTPFFNPGLVYLDTTSFEDRETSVDLLKETLNFCKSNTMVICNVMMNNPRAGLGDVLFDPDVIIDNLLNGDNQDAFKEWNISPEDPNYKVFHSYQYQTSCTVMRSYIFFKGVFPEESRLVKAFDKYKKWCEHKLSTTTIQ